MASFVSSLNERLLAVQLELVTNDLLNPPSSIDELLALLELWMANLKVAPNLMLLPIMTTDHLLLNVDQDPSDLFLDVLYPTMTTLVADCLLKHPNADVRSSVLSCLSVILRIFAPEEPFSDQETEAIFKEMVEAFSELSQPSTYRYYKARLVLDTLARDKACLLMMDLQLDELVTRMFQHFLTSTRVNHANETLWGMEKIMTDVINESEYISVELLGPLLDCVLKTNESLEPITQKLVERVISNSADKLRPFLEGIVQSKGKTLDDYAPIVAMICRNQVVVASPQDVEPFLHNAHNQADINASASLDRHRKVSTSDNKRRRGKAKAADSNRSAKMEVDLEGIPNKRQPKPNCLMNPDEGYDYSWTILTEPQTHLVPRQRKSCAEGDDLSTSKRPIPKELESGNPGRRLVGRRIKVWWPLDKTFYDGIVLSYDSITKKHRVLYTDGDKEDLNLRRERWELIEDDVLQNSRMSPENEQKAVCPEPGPSSNTSSTCDSKSPAESRDRSAAGDGDLFELKARSKERLRNSNPTASDHSSPPTTPAGIAEHTKRRKKKTTK